MYTFCIFKDNILQFSLSKIALFFFKLKIYFFYILSMKMLIKNGQFDLYIQRCLI